MRKTLTIVLAVCLLCTLFGGCGNTAASDAAETNAVVSASNDFEQLVIDGKYSDALEAYYNEISGDAGEENTAISFLNEYLTESLDAYAAGELSSTDFDAILLTLQKINNELYIITDSLTSASDMYNELSFSKECYENGMELMTEEQYADALDTFYNVSYLDTENYESAQSQITEAQNQFYAQTVEYAKAYIAEGNYDGVIFLLEDAEYVIGVQDEFDALMLEAKTLAAVSSITQMIEDGEYKNAFDAYDLYLEEGALSFSADFIQQMANWKSSFRSDILQQAKDAEAENEYIAAISVIDSGLAVIEDDTEFLEYKEKLEAEYEDYLLRTTPVDLTTLTPWESQDLYTGVGIKDVFGTSYDTAIRLDREGFATYRIDGVYSNFSGTIFLSATNTNYDSDGKRTIYVYGDGVLIYSASIAKGEDAFDFSVDVSGVRDLNITISDISTFRSLWSDLAYTYIGNPILTP